MNLLTQYDGMQWWLIAAMVIDTVLFVLFFTAVLYLSAFSFGSVLKRTKKYKESKKLHRQAVFFPVFTPASTIMESVTAFLQQDYPKSHYDLVVISNEKLTQINDQLEQMEVTLLLLDKESYTKPEAIRFAMASLPEKSYDVAVVMDSGNTTDANFLSQINNAYASGGMAIQTHRVARNIITDTALFQAVSQEVNNSIFRQGHVNLGLSSALIGSGMAFGFDWLKRNIADTTNIGLEKELEIMLLEQSILIEYLNDVFVYEEKANNPETFYKERAAWLGARLQSIRMTIRKFPSALLSGNFDYCDKLFQWIMPSRTIILGELSIITVTLTLIYWPLSLKWWGIWFLLIVAFSLAMPDHLIDARFIKAVKTMPLLFLLTLINRKKEIKQSSHPIK